MKSNRQNTVGACLRLVAACGAAVSLTAVASGSPTAPGSPPYLIVGSGATLQESFSRSNAISNDYIDADCDGVASVFVNGPDQLATGSPGPNQWWVYTYRGQGSVNGFQELVDWGTIFATDPMDLSTDIDFGIVDRTNYITGGVLGGSAVAANPGAHPVRSIPGSFTVTSGTMAPNGVQVDYALLDVPGSWAVVNPGAGSPIAVPGGVGYGDNIREAVNPDGSPINDPMAVTSNKLASLTGEVNPVTVNTNIQNPDNLTIFSTGISLTPVSAFVNYGVGQSQIDMSSLRILFATGRTGKGENLMAITRSSGSGTRNAFSNGICLDPSWCVGENIGAENTGSAVGLLGPNFLPSNKNGSGDVRRASRNHRLSVAQNGSEQFNRGDYGPAQMNMYAVRADIKGGNVYARPTLANVLDGGPDGYNIIGPASIVTIGDPRNAPPAEGGWGWRNLPAIVGALGAPSPSEDESGPNPNPNSAVAVMRNPAGAAFVNNITRSVAAFTGIADNNGNTVIDPGDVIDTLFSPGEFLAANFLLVAAANNVPNPALTGAEDCILPVANPALNPLLTQLYTNNPGLSSFSDARYTAFDFSQNGLVPTRTSGVVFTDNNGGDFYVAQDGSFLVYGASLNSINKISGDFNTDGTRDCDDAGEMMAAYLDRNDGNAVNNWRPGTAISIEVIGDFNGDGNFDAADVRYFADGLAIDPNTDCLNRCVGFEKVDNAWNSLQGINNFFGTALATGVAYTPGASAGDVFGPGANASPGFQPNGWDGVVDAHDIDYIRAQYQDLNDGEVDWSDILEASLSDLSCDMNGDLLINEDDVAKVVQVFLGTNFGDVDLDGDCDQDDIDAINNNLGMMNAGWADGDMDGDGDVDSDDLAIAQNCAGVVDCPGDVTTTGSAMGDPGFGQPDGTTNLSDLLFFVNIWNSDLGTPTPNPGSIADVTTTGGGNPGVPDGNVDLSDLLFFVNEWDAGLSACP